MTPPTVRPVLLVLVLVLVLAAACSETKDKSAEAEGESEGPTVKVTALETGLITPMDLVSDGQHLYFSDTNTKQGRIMRSSSDASSMAIVARDDAGPVQVAVDDTYVYWSVNTAFLRAPKNGGAPEQIARTLSAPGDIAGYDGTLYWTDKRNGFVVAGAPGDEEPRNLASNMKHPDEIEVDRTAVYFTADDGVLKIDRGGGTPTVLAAAKKPSALAQDTQSVYFAAEGEIRSVPKSGGAARTLAKVSGDVERLAVRGRHVYFSSGRTLSRVPTGGGEITELTRAKGSIGNIALLGDAVYWNDYSAHKIYQAAIIE